MLLELGDLQPADVSEVFPHAADPEVVRLLLAHGADMNARNAHGLTLYQRAARFKSPADDALLAAAGADTTLDPAAEWLGAVIRGETERAARVKAEHPDLRLSHDDAEDLPRWASAGDVIVVSRLLDAGVPIDSPGVDGGTALHYAAMWGRPDTSRLLLERGRRRRRAGRPRGQRAGVACLGLALDPGGRGDDRRLPRRGRGAARRRRRGHTAHRRAGRRRTVEIRLQEHLDNKRTGPRP